MTKKKSHYPSKQSKPQEPQKSSGAAPSKRAEQSLLPLWGLGLIFLCLEIAVVVFWGGKYMGQMTQDRAFKELAAAEFLKAAHNFEKLRANVQGDTSSLDLNLGHAYMGMRDYPAAIEAYKRVLAVYPKTADANALIGRAYAEMGQWEDALPYLEKEDELSARKHTIANFYLGRYYFEFGNYQKAAAYFQRLAYTAGYREMAKEYWDKMEKVYFEDSASTSALNEEGRVWGQDEEVTIVAPSHTDSQKTSPVAAPSKP
ncbi:MAG: tetratricopeptide repeat protein [bacterium]